MKIHTKIRFIAATALFAAFVHMAFGQSKVCVGLACSKPPKLCENGMCFRNKDDEKKFEKENGCVFGELCGTTVISSETTCCGKNLATGAPQPQDKYVTHFNDAGFNYADYQKTCPSMRPNEAKPDANWAQCVVGRKHSDADDWPIREVRPNGSARTYCIDGCSTPPKAVTAMYSIGHALAKDKDNPSGVPSASFYNACAAHDVCYQSCDPSKTQRTCDDQLLVDSQAACNTIPATQTASTWTRGTVNVRAECLATAADMHDALSRGFAGMAALSGRNAFNHRKQQYCQCC